MSRKPKSVDLTKLAKGMPCQIRVPHECNGNPETVVGCHVRMIGISGAGYKPLQDALAELGKFGRWEVFRMRCIWAWFGIEAWLLPGHSRARAARVVAEVRNARP